MATLEHVNVTVTNPDETAQMLCDLFDWKVRWRGRSMLGGTTVHVGTDDAYLAVFAWDDPKDNPGTNGRLNHVGVVVDDLDATEQRVIDAGFRPHTHGDYEPGRRFYFDDVDNIEYEVVSYA
jgi:hypothetical protein